MEALVPVIWVLGALALAGLVWAGLHFRHGRAEGLVALGTVVAAAITAGSVVAIAATVLTRDHPAWEQGLQIFAGLAAISSLLMTVRFAQALRRLMRRRNGG